MLAGYFDETGHADDPVLHFAGMAGFVASTGAWVTFEDQWQDTLKNAKLLEPFHMKDFAHSRGQFESWKGDENERRALLARLLQIICETRATPIGAAVSLRDFESLTDAQQGSFKNPYYVCFQTCTRGAAITAIFEESRERVSTVYATHKEFGTNKDGLAEQLWLMIKKYYDHGNRLDSYGTASPAEMCPLQAADLFAYELCHEFENRIRRPNDKMRWGMRRILGMYNFPIPKIRMFDRKELLRTLEEAAFADQTGVAEISQTQLFSAQENMMRWLIERGGTIDDIV